MTNCHCQQLSIADFLGASCYYFNLKLWSCIAITTLHVATPPAQGPGVIIHAALSKQIIVRFVLPRLFNITVIIHAALSKQTIVRFVLSRLFNISVIIHVALSKQTIVLGTF